MPYLKGSVPVRKSLLGSETETRPLQEGTNETIIIPVMWNIYIFFKSQQDKIASVTKPVGRNRNGIRYHLRGRDIRRAQAF